MPRSAWICSFTDAMPAPASFRSAARIRSINALKLPAFLYGVAQVVVAQPQPACAVRTSFSRTRVRAFLHSSPDSPDNLQIPSDDRRMESSALQAVAQPEA